MDTTKLEIQAEDYTKSTLLKYDFWVDKPQYDEMGGDLHILDNIQRPTRMLRIQSTGRSFEKSTNIQIPISYVDNNFVLFIYLVDESKNEFLYIFFDTEILTFPSNGTTYNLTISKNHFQEKYQINLFENKKIEELRDKLHSSKIKEETTLIIDGFALENALNNTQLFYYDYYPQKQFPELDILEVIKKIIWCYDKHKLENRVINVYLFLTPYNNLRTRDFNSDELYIDKSKIRIFEMRIDGLISFEVQDFLNRIIDSENIMLVASDDIYFPFLNELKNENKNVVLICEKLENRIRRAVFKWGDISHPIAFAMGLHFGEI